MRCASAGDRGGVTAEIAVALPSLALVLGLALAAVQAAAAHVACVDSARIGARALARGDSESEVLTLIARTAPESAETRLSRGDGMARVTVTTRIPIGPSFTAPVVVGGEAATPVEPGT
ncbi:TadE family type IV pilus minor pilin [Nocardiopsis sediminis]|uniref:TadE family type IV pilus minor pilin n=1 Tax=Nocardiopsis sediminis TaxID=1778267 RepID=A0ABV8FV46_9ACTN